MRDTTATLVILILIVSDALLDHWIDEGHLDSKLRQYMRDILLRKHKHSHQPRPKEEKRAARELHGVGQCY